MDIFFRNQIIQNIEHVGTSPELSLKIMKAVNDAEVTMHDVVKIILEDPSICAQVLKVANSPYYYRGERIGTMTGAVVHLGLENVRRILFAIEMIGLFRANSVMTRFNEKNFWKHNVSGALLASELGADAGIQNTESAYLCALLRNIGVLAIRQFLPREFYTINELISKRSLSFKQASKETIGIDHREITYLLCMRWNLPDNIIGVMGTLENKEAKSGMFHEVVQVITLADAVLSAKGTNEWDPFYAPECTIEDKAVLEKSETILAQVETMQQQIW
ncbi:MAG: HDOD domain-containing protein [Chitinispirillaceae bacterium]|nr:HDOD domain-containing protein [Chitinispirillaceae bacterium]